MRIDIHELRHFIADRINDAGDLAHDLAHDLAFKVRPAPVSEFAPWDWVVEDGLSTEGECVVPANVDYTEHWRGNRLVQGERGLRPNPDAWPGSDR